MLPHKGLINDLRTLGAHVSAGGVLLVIVLHLEEVGVDALEAECVEV